MCLVGIEPASLLIGRSEFHSTTEAHTCTTKYKHTLHRVMASQHHTGYSEYASPGTANTYSLLCNLRKHCLTITEVTAELARKSELRFGHLITPADEKPRRAMDRT